ncbi:MAG: hypothetical protein GKS02_14005 [Alphaproteobacteria bacterium]|nr:hypothetical protein [Alphaproteobacteria bacterium]
MSDTGDQPASRGAINFNTVFGIIGIVVGIALFIITPDQVERPRLLFGQKPSGLDPDFFPRLVAILFVITGGWLIWRARVLVEENRIRNLDSEAIVNVIVTLLGFLIMALVMPWLGFVISSIILLAVLSTFYGNRNLLAGAAVSIGVPLIFYNILRVWLQVVLPQNPFFPNILWF